MSQVFISYRREDSAGYAGRLRESLERRLGRGAVFRDVDALEPGQDFVDIIGIRLRDANACLVLIGREWLDAEDASGRRRLEQQNDYVRLEIATALEQPHMRVVPVLVEGSRMPSTEELPETIQGLARRQAVSLRDESWDTDVKRFVTALDRRSWLERYRLALAASAAVVVVAALVVRAVRQTAGFPGRGDHNECAVHSARGRSRRTVDVPFNNWRRSGGTTAGPRRSLRTRRPARRMSWRAGRQQPSPVTTVTGRTARQSGATAGAAGRASVPPTVIPTIASPAPRPPSRMTLVSRRPDRVPPDDDDVGTRPPADADSRSACRDGRPRAR